jgi:hypothetical protein
VLACPECGGPMRIIAFVLDRPTIERILEHIGEPTVAPAVSPARAPPQAALEFDQLAGAEEWPGMDQTAGSDGDGWARTPVAEARGDQATAVSEHRGGWRGLPHRRNPARPILFGGGISYSEMTMKWMMTTDPPA